MMEKLIENKKIFIANTVADVKMIFDPFRLRIIETIYNSKVEMNVKEIATAIEEAPNKVHYHVQKLLNYGALKLVRTENINGIIAKFYTNAYEGYMLDPEGGSKQVYDLTKQSLYGNLDIAVEKFKKDMAKYINLVEEKGKEAQRGLAIDYLKLYMTKEEKEDFLKQMSKLFKKYSEKDSSKEIYTMIHTITRVE